MSDERREAAWEQWKKLETVWGEEPPSRTDFMGGWNAAMAAKEGPVQIDRVIAKIKAARDWLDSEEAKVGTWWSPILRKQSIRTRFINKIDSALDAYLAAQPVAGAVETDTAKTVRQLHELCAGSGLSLEQALGAAGVLDKLATTEHALEAAAADVERLEREKTRVLDIAQEANDDCRKWAALLAESRAVIERVRAEAQQMVGYGEPAGDNFLAILSTSPAEALNAVKAEAKAEQVAKDAAFARAWLGRKHRESPARAFPDAIESAIRAAYIRDREERP